ncbi:hypothetical protein SAMN02745121_03054 [Nannocystis exedens]|uniref:Uncharacterized protein n=1 Tax=Nannocystis exedens TaxID=54 RepID=A0A1I1XSW5_9BACT|nr:hypothetical protein [Nannocystis exedens]PCC73219.1 hypothetical protein NAEX_06307 [Nannocystis exedens]SFE10412.1 hypothetical protein SAMN02745121_03054 [Nannocystis exedens]
MIRRIAAGGQFGWTLSLSLLSCGSDIDPLDTVGAGTNMSGPGGGPGGGDPSGPGEPTGGTTEASATGVATTTTSGDPTTSGGAEPGREICDEYLACLTVTMPEMVPSAQMGFGPMGTCWEGTPESIQQCINACEGALEALHMTYPTEPACSECEETADCPDGERCTAGSCNPPTCGDGIVDDGEICDYPENGCADCMGATCNPFTNQGCRGEDSCQLVFSDAAFTVCTTSEPLPEGAPCPMLQDYCGLGNICAPAEFVPGCAGTGCCAPLCQLQTSDACPDGLVCGEFFAESALGNYAGVCVPG